MTVYAAALAAWECVAGSDTVTGLVVYGPTAFIAGKAVSIGDLADGLGNTLLVGVGDVLGVVCAVVGIEICKVFHNL